MKRILSALVVLGALALAMSAVTQASQGAGPHATAASVNAECGTACPVGDGSACPGGCPMCGSQQSAAAAEIGNH